MKNQITWLDVVDKIAIPLLVGVLTVSASLGGMYLQSRLEREKAERNVQRERLEKMIDLVLQIESGINKTPAFMLRGKQSDGSNGSDIAQQMRQLIMHTELYFPTMKVPVNAFMGKAVATLDAVIVYQAKGIKPELEHCMTAAVMNNSTSRELAGVFDMAKQELKRLGT